MRRRTDAAQDRDYLREEVEDDEWRVTRGASICKEIFTCFFDVMGVDRICMSTDFLIEKRAFQARSGRNPFSVAAVAGVIRNSCNLPQLSRH